MSIFTRIKDAIFRGKHESRPLAPHPQTPSAGRPAPVAPKTASPGIPASPATAAWERREDVDVEAVLTNLSGKSPQKLNWQTSIVDLMKLLDIDSSLANRKELEKNGGKVPASLVA